MPQMAPYSWLNLFFMFNLILIYMTSYIYFLNFNFFSDSFTLKINKNHYSWKW